MKRVIRKGCFETNSSSMHSIVITKNDVHVTADEIRGNNDSYDERIYLHNGIMPYLDGVREGYGRWPFAILTTFEQKLSYALCEFLGCKNCDDDDYDETLDMFKDIVKKVAPEFKNFRFNEVEVDIYLDENGNPIQRRKLIYDGYDEINHVSLYKYVDESGREKKAVIDEEYCCMVPEIGIIDHQSSGLLKNFLKDKDISLEEFLTNKKYCIIIDGDEYCEWQRLKKIGFINEDFIVEEYDKSGEDVEYLEYLKEQERIGNEENNSHECI